MRRIHYCGSVVYLANLSNDTAQLYVAPIGGGANVKLGGDLPVGSTIHDFRISPDGNRVIYRADQGRFDIVDLYESALDKPTPRKLSDAISHGSVTDYAFNPDGDQVIYLSNGDDGQTLHHATLAGGPEMQLVQTATSESCFADGLCRITPDGGHVAFVTEVARGTDTVRTELLRTSIGANAPQRLDAQTSPDSDVFAFAISPDGRHTVYVADQDMHDVLELFLVKTGMQVFLPLLSR